MTSEVFILLTLCICMSQVTSYPVKPLQEVAQSDLTLETNYDLLARNMVKKDIFMSRGWGAAGMPYSMYYLDKPLPYQQRHKNRQSPTKADTKALYAKQEDEVENGLVEVNNYEALRSPSAEDSPNVKNVRNDKLRKLSNPPKNKYTIPQLFISYGWGPMG